jgi:hypothetical protein
MCGGGTDQKVAEIRVTLMIMMMMILMIIMKEVKTGYGVHIASYIQGS